MIWIANAVLCHLVGSNVAAILEWFAVLAVLGQPELRRKVQRRWRRERVNRNLEMSLRIIGREPLASSPPRVVGVKTSRVGQEWDLELRVGTTVTDLEKITEQLASSFRVRNVRVERHKDDAGRARLIVVKRDVFTSDLTVWPRAAENSVDFSAPIPVGVDESGSVVTCSLVGHHLLIGGESGAGKSNALSLLVASAALDPRVRLHLLDGKLVEFAPWADCASSFVGPSIEDAIVLIDDLRAKMDQRYATLASLGRRNVANNGSEGFDVVVCDELALYLTSDDKKSVARFRVGFRDVIARGRAAGVVVIAATQKPSTDVIPSSIRDLFGYRWALRCATRDTSDTVLGAGWASLGGC